MLTSTGHHQRQGTITQRGHVNIRIWLVTKSHFTVELGLAEWLAHAQLPVKNSIVLLHPTWHGELDVGRSRYAQYKNTSGVQKLATLFTSIHNLLSTERLFSNSRNLKTRPAF